MMPLNARITIRNTQYRVVVLDEPEVDLDPTLCVYRDLEEEPIATVHLDPDASCQEAGHVVAREVG